MTVFFQEPSHPDDSRPGWDETTVEWLRRSTQPQARAVREFLNRSLSYFPPKHAASLAKKLNQDWQGFFFEIVVGRYLQVLGADVVPGPKGSNSTDVDYQATFPDGVVISVECHSKRFNRTANRQIERHGNMALMLEDVGPHRWAIKLGRLPDANSPDEFTSYVKEAEAFYSSLPDPVEDGPRFSFSWTGDKGPMDLEAIPFPKGTMPNHLGPAVAYMDDSIQRLKWALIDRRKRKQALGARPPVFLAVECPFNGPDIEDIDQALFGLTVDHRAVDSHESVGISFNPNGLLVTDKNIPYAGVLAFMKFSMVGAGDPIVFLNPHQRWILPEAIRRHEQRDWTSCIEKTPAIGEAVINSIGFVSYGASEETSEK